MLDSLRKGAGTWVAKIFIGLLVLSFAVWGIADIFGGYGAQSLAKVGDKKIDAQEYRFALDTEMRRLGERMGRTVTMEDARATGLDRQVLFRLIGNAALESHGGDLKLGISEQHLAQRIMEEPAFRGPTGSFDQLFFQQMLRSIGLNEHTYVARQRRANVRQQLVRTLTENAAVPKAMLSAINRFEGESRTIRYITVPAAKAGALTGPNEDQLKRFYESRKRFYRAEEVRQLGLIALEPDEMAKAMTVDDDQITAYYKANKASYQIAERRKVQQIPFSDKAKAEAAYLKLKAGTGYMALALEQGLAERDIDLGLVEKNDLIDPAIGNAAFKLKKGAYSAPVVGELATAIVRVTDIEAKVETPFAKAKEQIRNRLAKERALNEILDLYDRIEDERAGGSLLAEIAKKFDLGYREVDSVTAKGADISGKPIADIPAQEDALRTAFEGDVGVELDPIETFSQGFVWLDVLKVTAERQKPIDEVRELAIIDWRKQQTRSKLAELAKSLVQRLNTGETLEAVARSLQLNIQSAPPVTRLKPSDQIPQAAIAQTFVLAENKAGSATTPDGKSRLVFKVTKITAPPALSEEAREEVRGRMNTLLTDDYMSQYLTGLRDNYGVAINDAAVDQITGRNR